MAKDSLDTAHTHLSSVVQYGYEYQNKIARSVGDYEDVEEVNSDEIDNNHQGESSGTVI